MADAPCCGPACCGTVGEDSTYGPQPFVDGTVDTFAGPVRRVTSTLSRADVIGRWRVRWNLGRDGYAVEPGLYAVGEPDDTSPVLVTANYKLTFDTVRSAMSGRSAWLLVLDTRGINVWCAAGKKTFGTAELIRRVEAARLEQVVSHQTLVVPQLGATGVAGRDVRAATGFKVAWGPVRANDIPEFLDAGMKATPEMRRVTFGLAERAVLVPVELSFVWRPKVLLGIVLAALALGFWRAFTPSGVPGVSIAVALAVLLAFVDGTVVVPLALPWIPGRAFSLKGALVGAATGALVAAAWFEPLGAVRAALLVALSSSVASFAAMNFTGSSTFTSPSGVEREMRRALPLQLAAVGAWLVVFALGAVL